MIDINAIWMQLSARVSNLIANFYYSAAGVNEAMRFWMDANGNVGIAIRAHLKGSVAEGNLIKMSTTSGYVTMTAPDDDMPVGVALETKNDGDYCWIGTHGIFRVLFKTGVTGTAGYVVYQSDAAGRADNSATIPSVTGHNREIGHTYATGTSGSFARVWMTHAN